MWLGAGVVSIIATPLLIGLTLPLTILIFFDFFEGLKTGHLGFPHSHKSSSDRSSAGTSTWSTSSTRAHSARFVFVILTGLNAWVWIKDPAGGSINDQRIRSAAYVCVLAGIAAVPFLVVAFGPLDLLRALTGFLTGERLV